MIKVEIKNPDGSLYWEESFNFRSEANDWLEEEKTRPYWKHDQYSTPLPGETPVLISKGFTYIISGEDLVIELPDLNDYKHKRLIEYPSIGDQLDAIYKKLHLNDSTDWDQIAAKISEVKAKYPKE